MLGNSAWYITSNKQWYCMMSMGIEGCEIQGDSQEMAVVAG